MSDAPATAPQRRVLASDPSQEYSVYVPQTCRSGSPILASIHGLSRNADEHVRLLAPYCDLHGVVLVVPLFTREEHPDYQRLGRVGRGKRADVALHGIVAEAADVAGIQRPRLHLFGYSGGAQFAHRYVMAHPHRVEAAVVASAGWYTWPDPTARFPYGTRLTRKLPGVRFDAEQYLRVPMHVIVGTGERGDRGLRRSERVDAQQGETRQERARRWVAAMKAFADAHGLPPSVTLEELDGAGHSFSKSILARGLGERVFEVLFGTTVDLSRAVGG